MFKTLFSRMLAMYLAVILVILLLLGATIATMLKNQYIKEQEEELKRESVAINEIMITRYPYEGERRDKAIDELYSIARKYNALIQVFDTNLTSISFSYVESDIDWEFLEEVDLTQMAKDLIDGNTHESISTDIFSSLTDIPVMTYMRTFNYPDGTVAGALFFHVDMSTVNESINRIYTDILIVACIAVLLAVFAVSYITGHITKPITKINSIVKRYTKGHFDLRIPKLSDDEIGQLADSFNVMADELDSLEQSRKTFVANVSHELRSPLTSMRGFLDAMRDGTIPESEFYKYLDIVIEENKRMTGMVNDLLDLARIESGQITLKKATFDINELIRRILITFETRINEKQLQVDVEFEENSILVRADADQIAQVVRNLIDNAIKFSREGGYLKVSTHIKNKQVMSVRIEDNGCGMTKEDQKHIFERFYKAEKAHTPKGGAGTGLGLAIVSRIIAQHGQTITVDSELGVGTVFVFTLQRAKERKPAKR